MPRLLRLSSRRTLGIGFLAVLAPLIILLALQWIWLRRLEKTTAVAHEAAQHFYVETVGSEVEYFYRATAERALNLPASLFRGELRESVARHWSKQTLEGVHRLFVVDFSRNFYGNFLVYDESLQLLVTPPASDESLAMIVAVSPWQLLAYQSISTEGQGLLVDERNPDFRFILNPILDDMANVVGVSGMILDEDYFRDALLPDVVADALTHFFPEIPRDYFGVTVRDGLDRIIYATVDQEPGGDREPAEATTPGVAARAAASGFSISFPFVFQDWTVELQGLDRSPEQIARASFVFNMTLSALLAFVLLGGVVLALRAANRAVALSEMKSDFVSNVSHELRTPLASIRAFGEFLKLGRAGSPDTVRKYGEHIEAESRRLSRLIDNILDFSRIESGRKTYTFVTASLEDVVAAAVETFQVRTRERGFRYEFFSAKQPLPDLSMDPDAIGLVLHNLLDNAVKYSGDSRRIVVRLEREGDEAVCSVQDFGLGIPREEQARVFERFHRVGTGALHDTKGSGLGLAIVQHVLEAHHGSVEVESAPGEGTTIRVHFPLEAGVTPLPEVPATGSIPQPASEARAGR